MFFPFANRIKVAVSEDSDGDNLIYTTPANYLAMVFTGDINANPDGATDSVVVYAVGVGDNADHVIFEAYGSTAGDISDGRSRGMKVFSPGTQIRALRNNEAIGGFLHVLLLPNI